MRRTNRLILVVGILLAVVAFVGVFFVLNQSSGGGNQPSVPQANVVVAKRDIKLGDQVTENDVEQQQIAIQDKKPEYIALTGDAIGQVARADIAKGAILTTAMFQGSGQTTIAKDLPAGIRAMAVRVDAVSGVGTLILPGDRVDMVITMKMTPVTVIPGQNGAPPQIQKQDALVSDSTKLILQNVEVRGLVGGTATSTATTDTAAAPPDVTTAQQIVIVGVTPQQAEVIGFLQQDAQTAGSDMANNNITLVLRSPQDKSAPDVKTSGVLLQTLIRDYGVLPPEVLEASLPPTK